MIIVFATFLVILVFTLMQKERRRLIALRSDGDWLLDLSGLFMQGVVIPFLQTVGLYYFFYLIFPAGHGVVDLSPLLSFFLSFVLIDYLYYWNHRILHKKSLWPFHRIHHTPENIDFLITSRNSLWSPFLLVYLWANGFAIFLLGDPSYYILGISLTAALDLWRHSGLEGEPQFLSKILITPKLHAWHHSTHSSNKNFGANFVLWDKIHGSYRNTNNFPKEVGIAVTMSTSRKLFFPFTQAGEK